MPLFFLTVSREQSLPSLRLHAAPFVFCSIFILCSILTFGVHTSASAGALFICSLLSLLRLAGASHSGVQEEFAGRVNL